MAQLLWTQKQDIGPSARSNVAMVFDLARERVVLFGGAANGNALVNDTWEWDGENWTQYEDIGPSPRSRHAMAYDAKRERVVLFGGSAGGPGATSARQLLISLSKVKCCQVLQQTLWPTKLSCSESDLTDTARSD
jgi:Galactose oxidase, central domain